MRGLRGAAPSQSAGLLEKQDTKRNGPLSNSAADAAGTRKTGVLTTIVATASVVNTIDDKPDHHYYGGDDRQARQQDDRACDRVRDRLRQPTTTPGINTTMMTMIADVDPRGKR